LVQGILFFEGFYPCVLLLLFHCYPGLFDFYQPCGQSEAIKKKKKKKKKRKKYLVQEIANFQVSTTRISNEFDNI